MALELRLTAEVLPGGRIEVADAGLPVGETVEVVVRSAEVVGQAVQDREQQDGEKGRRKLDLDEFWPVHSAGSWPKDLSMRREDMYEDRI